ncbi:MAG: 4Fe-4S binding protein [Chloroflexi bacterium]|nr:4Fe-4S binding protein [Chloroflexota bacterium]
MEREPRRPAGDQPPGASTEGGPPELTRRTFVKGAAAVGLAAGAGAVGATNLAAGKQLPGQRLSDGVIFPDPTLCIGCLTCEVRCSAVHKQVGLSAVPRIRIYNDPSVEVHPEIQRNYPDRGSFVQEPCLQCPTAECVHVCPVNAFRIEGRTGARYIDEDVCVSCGRCAEACPFPVTLEERATNGLKLHQETRITYDPEADTFAKCDMCYWRAEGPACVESCPVNIRIRQGIIKSDVMCLDAPKADQQTWQRLTFFQTFPGSPAPRQT